MPGKNDARPRYQRQPRIVHHRRSTSQSYHNELLGAALAVALCFAVVWAMGGMYQLGYSACERHAEEASTHA